MKSVQGIFKQRAYLLLALLLLSAQTVALAHAYEHDIGTQASPTCSVCMTANQLASACVGKPIDTEVPVFGSSASLRLNPVAKPSQAVSARQRGPPRLL
jgi:hypothetical protein